MEQNRDTLIWQIQQPIAWPEPPRLMSFSTLSELESCPRRWALNSASYPDIWDRRGYPRNPQITALEGSIIHLALAKAVSAFVKHKCSSLNDEHTIIALKGLGGYSALLLNCIEDSLRTYRGNPRAAHILDEMRRQLTNRIPELRLRVQELLSHIQLCSHIESSTGTYHNEESRHQLSQGTYSEIEIRALELGWHGFVDMLSVSDSGCEIRDFKTGKQHQDHELQLKIYALLWFRDHELNGSRRLTNKLILSYGRIDVEIQPPGLDELLTLEQMLKQRTAKALETLGQPKPHARPSSENCTHCSVRQLCEEYWKWQVECKKDIELFNERFVDLQVRLINQHGPSSWDSMIESASCLPLGQSVLLRTLNLPFNFANGQRLRLLNVRLTMTTPELDGKSPLTAVATMSLNSEVFAIR